MNKKTKIVIIAVSVVAIVATLLGVLYWGLQPVQDESVTLEKLNKKVGNRFCMPSKLPFEGDVECSIIYVRGSMGVVLTRFEISPKKSTGYSIELKDDYRRISVGIDGTELGFSDEDGNANSYIAYYKNQDIYFLYFTLLGANILFMQFEIDGKTYTIYAEYDLDVDSEILKSDMTFLLDQMIK